jgi:hypothetical protein
MDFEKLEALKSLKEKGLLTEEEFNIQQKELLNETENTTSEVKISPIFIAIGILFILGVIISRDYWGIPKCDNKNLLEKDLISTVESMPLLKFAGLRPIYVEKAIEDSYDETRKKRYCSASVKLSNTVNVDVSYTLEERNDQIYIEASLEDL